MLLRLSPLVPFNLQNYFFGITEIKFWPYVVATFVFWMNAQQRFDQIYDKLVALLESQY